MHVVLAALVAATAFGWTDIFNEDMAALHWQIRSDQWNDSVPCNFPVMGHEVGKFSNAVHFNYVGNPDMQAIRSFGLEDDNMFVTSFVLEALFEAMLLAPDVAPASDDSITAAIQAMLTVRDKNKPDDVPVFGFWPQQYLNASNASAGASWEQWPINLAGGAKDGYMMDMWLKQFLTDLGMLNVWESFGPQLAQFLAGIEVLLQIPSDADDTSVVLALQHFLVRVQKLVPGAFKVWNTTGLVSSKAFDMMLQYSYCPAHPDPDKNTIDPRTYFWSHSYFNNVTNPMGCFVTTWLQNISFSKGVALNQTAAPQMPLMVNNVDPTVCSNAIYAMSTTLLYGSEDVSWFTENPGMVALYLNSADFVHYAVSTQPWQTRPDLETLYYPPVYNLVYFVARHVRMLETFLVEHNTTTFPIDAINIAYHALKAAVRGGGMTYLEMTQNTTCWPSNNTETNSDLCWDGFLGNADTNALNESTPHYQDRFFSTGVVLNALIDTWSYVSNNVSQWVPETPPDVPARVLNAAMYLHHAMQQNDTSYDNAFFSGSGKYWEQYQFWYPANTKIDVRTGAEVDCANITTQDIADNYYYWVIGSSGAINDTEFDRLARIGCAGIPAPNWFTGYNGEKAYGRGEGPKGHAWPFWSAPVMSRALALQGMAKARSLL